MPAWKEVAPFHALGVPDSRWSQIFQEPAYDLSCYPNAYFKPRRFAPSLLRVGYCYLIYSGVLRGRDGLRVASS